MVFQTARLETIPWRGERLPLSSRFHGKRNIRTEWREGLCKCSKKYMLMSASLCADKVIPGNHQIVPDLRTPTSTLNKITCPGFVLLLWFSIHDNEYFNVVALALTTGIYVSCFQTRTIDGAAAHVKILVSIMLYSLLYSIMKMGFSSKFW